jgi:hypothetical protein
MDDWIKAVMVSLECIVMDTHIIPRNCFQKYWREINEKSRRSVTGG